MAEAIGKREQKKLLAKNRIIETAIDLFVRQGFQATSIADIMKASNMGLGTFYNYFASKEELLHCLLDNLAVQLQQRMSQLMAEQDSKAEILREMVMLTARLVAANRYVLPLFLSAGAGMLQEGAGSIPEHKDGSMSRPSRDILAAKEAAGKASEVAAAKPAGSEKPHGPAFMSMFLYLVKKGQQSGEFRQDVSAEIITEMFHSLFQAAAFSSLPLSFEDNINMKLKLIIDGIKCK